jgi:hypothetical protein
MSKTLIPLLAAGCLTIFGEATFARGRGCYCYAPCCPQVAVAAAPVAPAPVPAPDAASSVSQLLVCADTIRGAGHQWIDGRLSQLLSRRWQWL